jgi:hypothetical protein
MSLVKITIKDKQNEISCAKTSIVNLVNAKEALESSISSLTVQNQELQVQLEKCKNFTTSPLVIDSNASSSKTSTCEHCLKYHATCCLTNNARKNSSHMKVTQILKKCSSNDGLKKVEPKHKPLRHNNGKKGFGYNTYKVNPSIEHKWWRSPKFIEGTTLYDALGRIHSSKGETTPRKENLHPTKDKLKRVVKIYGYKAPIPISQSYLCDYMLFWDQGKLIVKYVGAHTKRKVMKKCVWVPKALTNTQGPNSIWVPKSMA